MNALKQNLFPDGYNHNLFVIYIFTFTSQFTRAIWEGNVISSYIYLISNHSNFTVGSLTGLNGFVQLLCSPLTGWAADKYSRVSILRLASIIGLMGTCFTVYSVIEAELILFTVCMCIWGMFWAFTAPTTDALLADSVNSGYRSKVYSTRLSVVQISGSFGPLLSIMLFACLGDQWTKHDCQIVMLCGLVLFTIPCVLLQCFRPSKHDKITITTFIDEKYYKIKSWVIQRRKKSSYHKVASQEIELQNDQKVISNSHINTLYNPLLDFPDDNDDEIKLNQMDELEVVTFGLDDNNNDVGDESDVMDKTGTESPSPELTSSLSSIEQNPIKHVTFTDKTMVITTTTAKIKESLTNTVSNTVESSKFIVFIPLMIACSDIITGLASGMTIKFFPIYFMKDLRMSPIAVSALYMVTPWFISMSAFFTQKLSSLIGRIWATVVTKLLGVSCLVLLTYLTAMEYGALYVLPVYIIRSALMNSSKPLTKSIIMDVVPKDQRARWNAAESINGATWAGSAMLGGYLIDKYGMIQNFILTAIFQFVSLCPLIVIARYVPPERSQIKDHT